MIINLKSSLALALVALGLPSDSRAQASARAVRMADSSVARIIWEARGENQALTRNYNFPDWVLRILRQSDRTVAASKIEALVDSLVGIAIAGHLPGQPDNFGWSFSVLVLAGSRSHSHGRPFEGVVERLIRISAESSDPIKAGMARHAMLWVIGGERAIPYLRELAMRREADKMLPAADAVITLIDDASGRGRSPSPSSQQLTSKAVLKELFDGKLVTSRVGQDALEAFAESQGWRRM